MKLDVNDWLMLSTILAVVFCSSVLLWTGNTVFPDKVYLTQTKIQTVPTIKIVPVIQQVPVNVTQEVILWRDKIIEVDKEIIIDLSKEKLGDCIRLSTDNGELLDCGEEGMYRWKI